MALPLELKNTSTSDLPRVSDGAEFNAQTHTQNITSSSTTFLPLSSTSHDGNTKVFYRQHRQPQLSDPGKALTSRTQLRKKPKSTSISSAAAIPTSEFHMRRLSGIPKPSGIQTIPHTLTADDRRPSSSSTAEPPTTPSLERKLSNSNPHRSPSQRRPPASHSSYGVETVCGPPPSYSTQKTLSQERIWNSDRNGALRAGSTADRENSLLDEPSATSNIEVVDHSQPKVDSFNPVMTKVVEQDLSSPDTIDTQSILSPKNSIMTTPPTTSGGLTVNGDKSSVPTFGANENEEEIKGSSSDEHKSEDLFLNIAKTDVNPTSHPEKRRSRISLPFLSSTRSTNGVKSPPNQPQILSSRLPGRTDNASYHRKRSSLGQHVPNALSRPPLDTQYSSNTGLTDHTKPSLSGDVTQGRRDSNPNNDTLRASQRSQLGRTSRLLSESGHNDRIRIGDHNATESTISTTAPSTVWDELDDLKSRIRKLELTGKLPPSSAAAMTLSERPRTATTAATTLSSSPKHRPGVASLSSAIEGIPSTVHPLLHEALSNAKPIVSNEVFQKLQATAHDALQMSSLMNVEPYGTSGSIPTVIERQLRRRTENMCRGLTELAIALVAESRAAASPDTRPGSRQTFAGTSMGFRSRRFSTEPVDRPPVTSRVQSRLDERRASIGLNSIAAGDLAPENTIVTPPVTLSSAQSSSLSRLGRTSTLTRNRRISGLANANRDDEEGSPAVRPVSRAMTEVGSYRSQLRDRLNLSREYTSQHPMPSGTDPNRAIRTPMASNPSVNLQSRRKYHSPSSVVDTPDSAPITSKEPWGRISIVPSHSSPLEATPDIGMQGRAINTRRSLGIASRISNVGSRLRAAKAERTTSTREGFDSPSTRDLTPSSQEVEVMIQGRREMSQVEEL